MKKRILCIIFVIMVLILAGCGKGNVANKSNLEKDSKGYVDQGLEERSAEKISKDEEGSKAPTSAERKIIKSGSISLEADDVLKTYNDILAYAAKNKGYEFNKEITKNGDYFEIKAVIKIVPEGLDKIMNYAGEQAEIIDSSVTSDDITSDYYDSQIRLKNERNNLEKYYEFLKKTENIDETIRVQNEINRITVEIEVLEGKIKLWDALVSESTLKISINQKEDPLKPTKEIKWNALSFKDIGTLMSNGFMGFVNFIVSALQWVLIILVTFSPLIIIAVIILIVILKKRKSKRNKSIKKDE